MTHVVRARCPSCQRLLRIPAEWLNQPMACKHCRQMFQARPAANGAPREPSPGHAATPTVSARSYEAPSNRVSFAYAGRGARTSQLLKAAALLTLVLAVPGAVLVVAGRPWETLLALKDGVAKVGKESSTPIGQPTLSPQEGDSEKEPVAPIETPKDTPKDKRPPKGVDAPFPRRALLINASNYLLFNPLHYGSPRESGRYPGSSTAVLADTMTRRPLNIPSTQIAELADAAAEPVPPSKETIEAGIRKFVATARAQDRIILLFTGHGIEIGKEAYLVPVESNREAPKTLLQLSWVYEQLAQCRARQKVLILDVFRFPPARGEELPGTGKMTEAFDAKLRNPPPGVQVWTSCIAGQESVELEGGSAFLQALCKVLQDGLPGIAAPEDPLPLDRLMPKVNQRLSELLAGQELKQVSRLSGAPLEQGGAPYDAAEPLPPRLVVKASVPAGSDVASAAAVQGIMEEINRLPPARPSQKQVPATSLPVFRAPALAGYQADYKNWGQVVALAKDKDRYPLRAAVLDAMAALRQGQKIPLKEGFGGAVTPQIKKQFFAIQQQPGILIFNMETALADVQAAGQMRDKETSKRWQAHYDYAVARLQSRIVYLYEYNNILAQVRGERLPPLGPADTGWRVGSQKKVQISEPKVRQMVKDIGRTWKRIADEHPGTPWAVLATRENMMALGLVWRPSRD